MPIFIRPAILLFTLLPALMASAMVRLPGIFGDNMLLQRGRPIPVWGSAAPGEHVTVTLGRARAGAVAGKDGQWAVRLPAMKAGGPYTLTVTGANTLTVRNILLGELWLCAGQSNMEWPLRDTRDAEAEIAAADYPQIRLCRLPKTPMPAPRTETDANWQPCTPATIPCFSAAGYFFARELYRRLRVPIGLINANQGGSTVEQWMPAAALNTVPAAAALAAQLEAQQPDLPRKLQELDEQRMTWTRATDALDAGYQRQWYAPTLDTADWKTMELPRWMDGELQNLACVVWFRRDVDVPASMAARPLDLCLGPVDDNDITWVNGVKVGEMMADASYAIPRYYHLPAGLVHAGRNTVVVRVLNRFYGGGLPGYRTELRLVTRDAPESALPLSGPWRYRIGFLLKDAPPITFLPAGAPTYLYNGIIAPLTRVPVRGVLWYQGESNVGQAERYRQLLTAMIRGWRAAWGGGNFPFLIVQLPNLGATPAQPAESRLAEFREAQQQVLAEPQTGMIVTIDIGEAGALHPRNKQDVGLRLGLLAERMVYRRHIIAAGPLYRDMRVEGAAIRVRFTTAGRLTTRNAAPLTGFAIAGKDGKFDWADAVIDGNSVLVSSPRVPNPTAVRYAWSDAPLCNLLNTAHLPATPFRTKVPGD